MVLVAGSVAASCLMPTSANAVAMPTPRATSLWTPSFVENFNGSALNKSWGRYSGTPGGNPTTTWRRSQLSVTNGALRIRAQKQGSHVYSGGVCNCKVAQLYGKWDVRLRVTKAELAKFVVLLWPTKGWPPEVDIAEDSGGNRKSFSGYVHWTAAGKHKFSGSRSPKVNTKKWIRVGVQWRPNLLEYTINGKVWKRVTGSTVPRQKMWLAIQSEGTKRSASQKTKQVDLLVDWVKVYRWTP